MYITVVVSLVVCPVIMVIIWGAIIPLILSKYTVITNVGIKFINIFRLK